MNRLSLSALLLIAALLVVLSAHGAPVGLSPDSRFYFAAAESLLDGRGFFAEVATHPLMSGPFVLWPPLYPALLATLRAVTGLPLAQIASLVNLAAMMLVLLALARMLRNAAPIAALLIFLSPAFITIYGMAWTEPLFLAFVALFLAAAHQQNRRGMIAFAILGSLTRYTGVALIATGALFVLYRRGWQQAARFAALSALPLALWLARNWLVSGTLMGPREPSVTSLGDNLALTGVGLLVQLAPAVMLVVTGWRLARTRALPREVAPPLLFAAVYLLLLLVASTTTRYDPIHHRLLSPILPAVAIITAASISVPSVVRRTSRPQPVFHADTVTSVTFE